MLLPHEKKVIKFYSKRYKSIGNKIQSVGWNSVSNQNLRFKILLKNINLKNKTILDYGCGFAHLLLYLRKNKNYPISYSGYDIVKEFIVLNRKKFKSPNFYYNENFLHKKKFDYILCSGVFSFDSGLGKNYLKKKLIFLINQSKKGVLLNFLYKSTKQKLTKNLYYSFSEVKYILKNMKNIKIRVNKSYGLKEFTIQILKV